MTVDHTREIRRQAAQDNLDRTTTKAQRNKRGQVATPPPMALQILEYATSRMHNSTQIKFLDPAVGTGAFFSALLSTNHPSRIASAHGYETDPRITRTARDLWSSSGLTVHQQDFTTADPPGPGGAANLVICNPPYVRHHHIGPETKAFLKHHLQAQGNMELSGLAGLYAYFMALTHPWMTPGALAGWLIPSEFLDVNYGQGVRDYLTTRVSLHHIHRFDPEQSQFGNALVSSAVVWFTHDIPAPHRQVRITFGGSLAHPMQEARVPLEELRTQRKWSGYPSPTLVPDHTEATLADLFKIKRGIATGNNSFFVLSEQQAEQNGLPGWALRPVLPPARRLKTDIIQADTTGLPTLKDKLFLLDCPLDPVTVEERSQELSRYIQHGQDTGVPAGYLCQRRTPWYSQEQRPPPPFLCTYMGRQGRDATSPFRFILNHSRATALNVYLLLYPKEQLAARLAEDHNLRTATWQALKAIHPRELMQQGRVYGGGLHKLEPRELGRVLAGPLLRLCNR